MIALRVVIDQWKWFLLKITLRSQMHQNQSISSILACVKKLTRELANFVCHTSEITKTERNRTKTINRWAKKSIKRSRAMIAVRQTETDYGVEDGIIWIICKGSSTVRRPLYHSSWALKVSDPLRWNLLSAVLTVALLGSPPLPEGDLGRVMAKYVIFLSLL